MGWFSYNNSDIFEFLRKNSEADSYSFRKKLNARSKDFDINYYTFKYGSLLNTAIRMRLENCALVFLDVFKDTINVNLIDYEGNNALMLAVKRNDFLLVEEILKHNPNIQRYNLENQTVFDLTQSPGITRALKEYELANHIVQKSNNG